MYAGQFKTRITIQHYTDAEDASGATVKRWEPLAEVWANVRHLSGYEAIKADAVTSVTRASVRIRLRTGINAGMRVLANGLTYEIKSVQPDLTSRQHVDLVCEVRGE